MDIFTILLFISIPVFLGVVIYARNLEQKYTTIVEDFKKRNLQLRDRVYELSVLQEVSRSISYALNIEKVADVISGSVGDLLEYTASSYLIYTKGNLDFKAYINNSVHPEYIKTLQRASIEYLSKHRKISLNKVDLHEDVTGSVFNNSDIKEPKDIIYIPLCLNKKHVGVLALSSNTKNFYKKDYRITVLKDITKQAMHAVENLQRLLIIEKGKLSTMVESLADGVFFVDPKMKIVISNSSAKKMLGLYKDDINILDVYHKLESVNIQDKIAQALTLDKTFVIPEVEVRGKHLRVLISQVTGAKEVIGVVLLIQDITQQKELEKMREDFTSMMVHDLRAPLTVMSGSADILIKRDGTLKKEQRTQLLFDIKKGANSLLEIVNDLLDVAKMEHGKFKLHPDVLDITLFAKTKAEYFRSLVEERGLDYIIKVPNEKIFVEFDENLIGRVLSNLISNANKFTEKGVITFKLEKIKNQMIKISITDTGVGISKDSQKHLFNKFEQLRNPVDSKQKGTGLGLVISKNIIKEHGGDIGVDSKVGEGSVFWFTLPIKK